MTGCLLHWLDSKPEKEGTPQRLRDVTCWWVVRTHDAPSHVKYIKEEQIYQETCHELIGP